MLDVLSACGRHYDAYWFRTSDQYEIDLVLDLGKELWAIEVKLTASPSIADMDRLNKTANIIGAKRRFLISQVRKASGDSVHMSCNLPWFLSHIQQ